MNRDENVRKIFISKAPDDPEEKKDWVEQMMRIQLAMYVDGGAICVYCKHQYISVDDFIERNPKRAFGEGMRFCCNGCWPEYEKQYEESFR